MTAKIISTLPKSYPGHSLLTEDVGRAWHNPVCQCGDKGTVVEVPCEKDVGERCAEGMADQCCAICGED